MPEIEPARADVSLDAKAGVPFKETQASVWLDGIRGLAALLVLGEHWRNLLFVDYPQLVAHRLLWLVPYLLTGAGRQMVVIFFVLSGYLVGGSVLKSVERRRWDWRRYLVHRLVRLWVVLLPGLLLCALWDHAGLWLRQGSLPQMGAAAQRLAGDAWYARLSLSAKDFIGNVFFLQGIRLPMYGTDSPLWSLSYEFWYYMLFPLGWVAVRGQISVLMRVFYCLLFLGCAWVVGPVVLSMFPIWLLGVVLAKLPRLKLGVALRWLVVGVAALTVFWLAKYRGPGALYGDYGVGLMTFLALWAVLSDGVRADPLAGTVRAARRMARFSYTLYIAHMPLLVLLTGLVVGDERWVPGVGTGAQALVLLGVVLLYAYGVAWATEFHTDRVRSRVELWLGLTPASAGVDGRGGVV